MKGFIPGEINISIKIYKTLYQYSSVIPVSFSSTLPFFAQVQNLIVHKTMLAELELAKNNIKER